MKNTARLRVICFIVIQFMVCACAFLYSREYDVLRINGLGITQESIYIDGSDMTPLYNAMSEAYFGILGGVVLAIYFGYMAMLTAGLIIPLRLIAVRKNSLIKPGEHKAALGVILGGIVLTTGASALFISIESALPTLILLIPALIMEMLIYWLCLFRRGRIKNMSCP